MGNTKQFYESLSEHYHLLLADWEAAVHGQGEVFHDLIAQLRGPGPRRILDATCGIGTQAIGLALQGHDVTGYDLSPAAVARGAREAARFGVEVSFDTVDMRRLESAVTTPFAVVCALDNALAHFMTDADLDQALGGCNAALAPGGLFLASARDYDALLAERPTTTPIGVYDDPAGRRLVFQVWDWDGDRYDLTIYLVRHLADGVAVMTFLGRCRALRRAELDAALARTGFAEITWLEPGDSGFYQPIVAARRP